MTFLNGSSGRVRRRWTNFCFTFIGAFLICGIAYAATIAGNNGPDVLQGTVNADDIFANGGDDRAYGNNGGDRVFGGDGADNVQGEEGIDVVYGGNGADLVYGGSKADIVHGDESPNSSDQVTGGGESDAMYGDGGADAMVSWQDSSIDPVEGNGGIDTCWIDSFDVALCEYYHVN